MNNSTLIKNIFRKYWWAFVAALFIIRLSLSYKQVSNENIPAPYTKTLEGKGTTEDQFDTSQVTQETLQQLYKGEMEYNNKLKELYAKYPWYQKIPIETDLYSIVFDFEVESFRIRYKEGVNKKNPTILEQALQDIRNIGADPSKYYIINP